MIWEISLKREQFILKITDLNRFILRLVTFKVYYVLVWSFSFVIGSKFAVFMHQSRVPEKKYVHYGPLMMSQKEAPRKHPWALPRKVVYLV